jgi:sortase (surface protein transpeptidase)
VGAAVAVLTVAALTGCGSHAPAAAPAAASVPRSSASGAASPSATGAAKDSAAADAAAKFRSPRTYTPVAVPVRLRIPAIGVDAPLERLGLDVDGTIEAPKQWQDAGWYEAGPRPGQPGPAVLLGHVDSDKRAAVFYRLSGLAPGALVLVDRADRTTARFRIQGRMQVAKSRFPADLVYAPTLAPSLRLVTCGGTFNKHTGHYRDNIVLTAVPDGSRR